MIIGYDTIGIAPFRQFGLPIYNISYLDIQNAIFDSVVLQTNIDRTNNRETWGAGTVLLATFNNHDLEAGNIQMRGNPIDILRIKRRNLKDANFKVINEMPFNPEPTQVVYDDYTVSSDVEYEYVVVPVDSSGIEGFMTASYINPKFDGWWIVDPDEPEKYNFQFLYNLDDVSVTVDEDRTEISTFSKFPKVYYGHKYARRGSLSGLFIPEGYSAKEQYEKLIEMINKHTPYILKDGYGRNFRVDISTPQEVIQARMAGVSKVTVNWVEVGEVDD